MDGQNTNGREDVYSKPVKAGKRTYFFDVKSTRKNEFYLTITESKRRIDNHGKFHYDKHKIFLYKEDFAKFMGGLNGAFDFIKKIKGEDYGSDEEEMVEVEQTDSIDHNNTNYSSDISFDDLDDDDRG